MKVLAGKRVVVTRADEQADALCEALEALGAEPIRCPTIRIVPPPSFGEIDAGLRRLDTYDWVVFTSANGVRTIMARAEELGLGPPWFAARKVAAVGRVTAGVLHERGVPVAFVPSAEGSSALADTLPDVEGRAVLLAIGDKADPLLGRVLRARGARQVDVLTAYLTVPLTPGGEMLDELRNGADAITFTSPSTVEGFVSAGAAALERLRRAVVVTIGPMTSAAARNAGLRVDAEAHERSARALIEAVATALTATEQRKDRVAP